MQRFDEPSPRGDGADRVLIVAMAAVWALQAVLALVGVFALII